MALKDGFLDFGKRSYFFGKMLSVLNIVGEKVANVLTNLTKGSDGSWIAIQTEKPVYYAGETVRGYIVCQINSPRQCRSVTLRVKVKESTKWDVEREKTTQVVSNAVYLFLFSMF